MAAGAAGSSGRSGCMGASRKDGSLEDGYSTDTSVKGKDQVSDSAELADSQTPWCDGLNGPAIGNYHQGSGSSDKVKDIDHPDDSGSWLTPDLPELSMDCLPVNAVVCVEGEDASKKISWLTKGSRVLCFHSLGRSVRYAEVRDVRQHEKPALWLAVELSDGTKTILSADNPVQLAGQPALQNIVKARDIEPQKSQIVAHRVSTAPVDVRSVVALPPGLVLPSGRVSVTVQQSNRNAILAASPQHGHADARFVAVGSADLAPRPFGVLGKFGCDAKPLVSPGDAGQRSSSWPPSVGSRPVSSGLELPTERTLKLAPHSARSSSSSMVQCSSVESGSETSSAGDTLVVLP